MDNAALAVNASGYLTNQAARECLHPAVSVVISLYNYARYIRDCLESVQASHTQGLPGGFEVIIVDDASTDTSVRVVEEYMAAHPLPVCLVKRPVNCGLADARNVGLHVARAPLVFILDADNKIRPDCLQAHYQAIVSSGCAVAYATINRFDHATLESVGTMSDREWDVRELVSRPYIDAMAMIRKEPVLEVGGYSPESPVLPQGWEDYDLWLKLAQAGHSGKWIPQVLSDYRVHPHSMIHGTNFFRRDLALYFSRKFHFLVQSYPDSAELFGFSRRELQVINRQPTRSPGRPKSRAQKLAHRILGRKLSTSISKRLASAYAWIHP
jgi:glycosyltransferase involved in cell wall biosynthesis